MLFLKKVTSVMLEELFLELIGKVEQYMKCIEIIILPLIELQN